MKFIPRLIERFLDFANLQKHNDNYADIATALDDLAGSGRTTETIKANADAIANTYTKAQTDAKDTAVSAGAQNALDNHKASGDHDVRYNTKSQLQTSGEALVHWDNITDKPNFADARWKAPAATFNDLPLTGNEDGDIRLVLDDETVYQWDGDNTSANKWVPIGAMGNGLTSHSSLKDLTNDDHPQYHTDARGDSRYYLKAQIDSQMETKINQGGPLTADLDFSGNEARNFIVHRSTVAPVNPEEGQQWYDTTNQRLMLYKGAVEGWVDISGKGAVIRDEDFEALPGQTVFDITVGQYETNTNAITVYKMHNNEYCLVPESEYIEKSPSQFELVSAAAGGEKYYVKFFENRPEVINQSVKRDGTLQVNLNSDMLGGHHADYFATQTQATDHEGRIVTLESETSAVQDELSAAPAVPVTVPQGVSIVNADRKSRFKDMQITGRTLVNLPGREGGCESLSSIWATYQTTFSLDTVNFVSGKSSYKVTIQSGFNAGNINNNAKKIAIKAGRKYIFAAEMKNGTASNVSAYLAGTGMATVSIPNYSAASWGVNYVTFDSGTATELEIGLNVTGAAGQYGNFDDVRVYEVTQAEYDAIDSMTPEQIAAMYPYVDDMKHVNAVYVQNPGKNLLPPFSDWLVHEFSTVVSPYRLALSARTQLQQTTVRIKLKPNTTYVYSATHDGRISAGFRDGNQNALPSSAIATNDQTLTFTTGANVAYADIGFDSGDPGSNAVAYIENPMLNIGSTALPFEPQKPSYVFLPDCNLRSNVDGSVADRLYMDGEGKPRAVRRFREMSLDGSLGWTFDNGFTGFKRVKCPITAFDGSKLNKANTIKYDGKILPFYNFADPSTNNVADMFDFDLAGSTFKLFVSGADTGWGDDYTPTEGEIKTYFNGWKMFELGQPTTTLFNGSGTKAWCKIGDTNPYTGDYVTVMPIQLATGFGYTPYRLMYELAQSVDEPVTYEGELMLHDGPNQIVMGTGIVVREEAKPAIDGLNAFINISTTWPPSASPLSKRANRILRAYQNNEKDIWLHSQSSHKYGNDALYLPTDRFDPTAAYSVTYLALDTYKLGIAPLSIIGAVTPNIKETVDDAVQAITGIRRDVSVLQNTKAQKQLPQWIEPTFLNGFLNFDTTYEQAGYLKDDGFLHIRGLVKSGTIGTVIFYLPRDYRPSKTVIVGTVSKDISEVVSRVTITPDGAVVATTGTTALWFSLDLPPIYIG
jgi:hypothetical protein